MFSPLAFPIGRIVYDLATHYPPPSHVALSPFETYREPLVIIAIADGAELDHVSYKGNPRRSWNGTGPPRPEHLLRGLDQDLEDLRDAYPKALVHQLLLFDYVPGKIPGTLPEGLVAVPPPADCKRTTMKTIMCDISSMLLAEMTTLAKSIQGLTTIESPKLPQGWGQSGDLWSTRDPDMLSRRTSQYVGAGYNSRPVSPAGSKDRSQARMTMPAQLRPTNSYSENSSSAGGPNASSNGQLDLPTSFDQIIGQQPADPKATPGGFAARFMTPNPNRDTSRDRVSVQGFGPGSISERSRNIGRGRIGIVIGSLYLHAGRWNDAIKELVDGATIAKTNLDHLWHAKALENIMVGMLMLGWTGLDFQIPQLCYISADKAPSSADPRSPTSNRLVSLQNLTNLLPELCERILNLYARAANNTGESLPQLPYSETIIRISKLMSAVHLAGGIINDDVLQLIVAGVPLTRQSDLLTPRLGAYPSRTEIATMIFRAFPPPLSLEQLTVVDRSLILGGIASVLGSLGFHRKKAMVVRELVSVLIPGLVQARIAGAAEIGVHPAAGLAALASTNGNSHGSGALDLGEGDVEVGVNSFLSLLGRIYGVVTSGPLASQPGPIDDSDESVIARIVHDANVRSFGGQMLKMDVLRSCINLSEALPDFYGVLKFTADLLRTAGSGVAPGPRSEDASPAMSREEQIRLTNNISRTLSAAKHLGVSGLAAEYWDEFLVRGVDLEPLPISRTPIPHARSDLPGAAAAAASQERNPFIYNPFLKTPDAAAVDHLLVAGEGAVFKVTLQNPYEFDVEVERIALESEGVEFESSSQNTVIGPYRTQILTVPGTPKVSGQLKITGCVVKVKGCRERRFPIFTNPWSPRREAKIKSIGLSSILKPKARPISTGSELPNSVFAMAPPKTATLRLNVIEKQPVVVVKSTTLSQSAVMILEGERQTFSVTLENLSKDTSVDLLLFSFKDSTQGPLQTAMSNREVSAAELYEMELIFARKQALRWIHKGEGELYIAPGATATFEMEILGKPGLTSAMVQVDYAYLGSLATEVQSKFYTRQVGLPITVTVNASIELARMDVLPLTRSIPKALSTASKTPLDGARELTPDDYCLLLLDLRNAWPSQLHVHLDIDNGGTIDEEILPGNTSRIMFPIRRVFLSDPSAAIPALDPSRQRQFVVSTGRISADSERASREAFWYREEILRMVRGTWSTNTGFVRKGDIELRGIRLSQRVVEAVKIDDIGIDISINGSGGHVKHKVYTDSFSEIKVRISNRASNTIFPLLRIQPSIRNQPHNISLDLSKKFVCNGTLQQTLSPLASDESIEVVVGMTALSRGEYEISASVEEAKLLQTKPVGSESGGRPRANTRMMMDAILGTKERRIWHSRQPCLLTVRDDDSDDDDE